MSAPRDSSVAWKAFVAALAAIIALLYVWALSDWPRYSHPGDLGAALARVPDHQFEINRLAPDSPLAAAQAEVGDRIRFDDPRVGRRFLGADERLGLDIVSREGSRRHVEIAMRPAPPGFFTVGWGAVLTALVSALAIAIGVVIGLRRADDMAIRFLAVAVLMQPVNYVSFRLPPGAIPNFLAVVYPLAPFALLYFCFLAFCLTFPGGQVGPLRSRMRRFLLVPGAVIALTIGLWGMAEVAGRVETSIVPVQIPFAIGFCVVSLVALAVAWVEARGVLRSRIGWIAASIGLVYLSYLWSSVMQLLGLTDWIQSHQYLPAGLIAAGYFGLAYALLRHRLFDLGFVVNRALVYGAASAAMLLAFGLLEWLVHKVVHFESQQQNAFLDAGIALAVFLAFNKIHHRAESGIERLFFHAWQVREEALRTFVKRAAHVASPDALVEAFRDALARFCRGARVAIHLREADGSYRDPGLAGARDGVIGRDDPIAVALRTEPVPMLIEEGEARSGFELALPMSHRGEVNGIVLVERRSGGETYRPDEIELLGFAAHQVGLDLHALEVERLRRELAEGHVEIAAARAKAEAYRALLAPGGPPAE
ncbi:MAG: GAF domain-containing protein [Usitatibacter sp.]